SGETFFLAIAAARSNADIQQRASLAMARVSSREPPSLPRGMRVLRGQRPARGSPPGGGPGGARGRASPAAAGAGGGGGPADSVSPACPAGALDQGGILRAEQRFEPAADLTREGGAAAPGGDGDLQLPRLPYRRQ